MNRRSARRRSVRCRSCRTPSAYAPRRAYRIVDGGIVTSRVEETFRDHDALDLVRALVDLRDLGVSHEPSAGMSLVYPTPPRSCTQSVRVVHRRVGGEQLPHRRRRGRVRATRRGAVQRPGTRSRAASTGFAMSASMNCTPWKSAIRLPNWLRSCTDCVARSSAPWAMPRPRRRRAAATDRAHPSRTRTLALRLRRGWPGHDAVVEHDLTRGWSRAR